MKESLGTAIVRIWGMHTEKVKLILPENPIEQTQQLYSIISTILDDRTAHLEYDPEALKGAMQQSLGHLITLATQATHDPLTGMLNVRGYNEHAPQLMDVTRRLEGHLLYVVADMDKFKLVNDTYGHQAGDRVLSALGQASRDVLRNGDLACRIGGDEFVFLLPAATTPGKEVIARLDNRYCDILREQQLPPTSLTYGHATYDEDVRVIANHARMPAASLLETLKSIADSRMYTDKRNVA